MTEDGRASFEDALAARADDGGAFLVCGDVPRQVHEAVCERWLGAAGRARLVVGTDRGSEARHGPAETVRFDATVRSTTATAGTTPDAAGSVASLGTAALDAIARLEAESDGARGVRVCVESLAPLVSASDAETVFRFLHLLGGRVRQSAGLMHVHLTTGPDEELARTLAPLFDGRVALRTRGGRAEQRWHLDDPDVTSGWLPVSGDGDP
jgi:hypothetical protein